MDSDRGEAAKDDLTKPVVIGPFALERGSTNRAEATVKAIVYPEPDAQWIESFRDLAQKDDTTVAKRLQPEVERAHLRARVYLKNLPGELAHFDKLADAANEKVDRRALSDDAKMARTGRRKSEAAALKDQLNY